MIHPNGAVRRPAIITAAVEVARMPFEVSVVTMRRVRISRSAVQKAEDSGNRTASVSTSPVGRAMITMPRKPTVTADQRRHPTGSPSRKVASAVTKSGVEKPIAVTSASGRNGSPMM